jgi:N-acetylglucosaminyldiphosphoundecaprenol N-acetyl-beta-D-mannosaminyltransferase
LDDAVDEVLHTAVRNGCGIAFRLANSFSFAAAHADPDYLRLCARAVSIFRTEAIGGGPSVVATGLRHRQVRGPSFFETSLTRGRLMGLRQCLLGATPETPRLLVDRDGAVYPCLQIVGSFSSPFRLASEGELREKDVGIIASAPQIVWVGLGIPKQGFEAHRIATQLGFCAVGVGAAFDFFAQVKPEAPAQLRRVGLEWLFRLMPEPSRLFRRYLVGEVLFIKLAVRQWRRSRR